MSNTTPQPNFPTSAQNAPQYPGVPGQQPQAPQQTVPVPSYARAAVPQNTSTRMGDTNTFAVLAIIFAFIAPIAGIIFGHLALSQIKRNGDAGRGIGLTGLIISYSYFVLLAIFIVAYIGLLIMMFGAMGAAFSEIGSVSSYDSYDY